MFTSLCGYMVTTVTVTVSMSIRERQKHYGWLARGNTKARRGRHYGSQGEKRHLSTVRLYPNDCVPIRKQLFAYTRFKQLYRQPFIYSVDGSLCFKTKSGGHHC